MLHTSLLLSNVCSPALCCQQINAAATAAAKQYPRQISTTIGAGHEVFKGSKASWKERACLAEQAILVAAADFVSVSTKSKPGVVEGLVKLTQRIQSPRAPRGAWRCKTAPGLALCCQQKSVSIFSFFGGILCTHMRPTAKTSIELEQSGPYCSEPWIC